MGAGISIASNTADAVASAYTSVLNQTAVFQDSKVIQDQSINLDNCDISAKEDIDIYMTNHMKQAQSQIAQVQDTNKIANNIAQALSQAADSTVGAGVLGIADSNNKAAVYANMNTNITNYVKFSSIQDDGQTENFTCQDSTIISKDGSFNLSELQYSDTANNMKDKVMNSNDVTNSITQSISQTATSSTGMSWWVVLAIVVLIIVAVVIFKLKDAKMKATHAMDLQQAMELGCCTNAQIDIGNISGGGFRSQLNKYGGKMTNQFSKYKSGMGSMFSGPQISQKPGCAGCDCYQLMHPEAHVSKAAAWTYAIGIVLLSGLIGIWFAMISGRGCLYNSDCTSNSGSKFTGCSCNYAEMTEAGVVCTDTFQSGFKSNGLPRKYQFGLFVAMGTTGNCTQDGLKPNATLQGMLVAALASQTSTHGSNNGKNMDTLNTYISKYGWPDDKSVLGYQMSSTQNNVPAIQLMFQAAAQFLNKDSTDNYPTLGAIVKNYFSGDNGIIEAGRALYFYLCPLRPALFTEADPTKALTTSSGFYPQGPTNVNANQSFMSCSNTFWPTSTNQLYGVQVPDSFRYGTQSGGGDCSGSTASTPGAANPCAGCCSIHSMKYDNTSDTAFMVSCGSDQASEACAEAFCNGSSKDGCTSYSQFAPTLELRMKLPDTPKKSKFGNKYGSFPFVEGTEYTFYAEFTLFKTSATLGEGCVSADKDVETPLTDYELSLIRLLWSGILAYSSGLKSDVAWGLNSYLNISGVSIPDHYYVRTSASTGANVGKIGEGLDHEVLNDPTMLTLTPTEDLSGSYSVLNGMDQASCPQGGVAFSGQGYSATAQKLGYCRSPFFNRVTLYTIIGFLALWILLLPIFLIVRWYVNKGVSRKYLAISQNQYRKRNRNQPIIQQSQPQTQQPKTQQTQQPTQSQPSPQPTPPHPLADVQKLKVTEKPLESTSASAQKRARLMDMLQNSPPTSSS